MSTVVWALPTAAYVFVAIIVWRTAAYVLAHDMTFGSPDPDDIGYGIVAGAFLAAIWPLTVLIYKAAHWDGFLLAPKRIRREADRDALQKRIRELERQVEIS